MKFIDVKNREQAIKLLKIANSTTSYFDNDDFNILTVEDQDRNYLFSLEGGDGITAPFENLGTALSDLERAAK